MKQKLLLSAIVFFVFSFLTKAQVSQLEFDALVALYNSTNGDSWTDNSNWNISTGTKDDVTNDWFGITVANGHVTTIQLYDNNLVGTLPSNIGDFPQLRIITLLNNKLSGSIPAEIGNLTSLTYLHLATNELSGSIPASIGNLSNLSQIYLTQNQLTGSIPVEISNLTNLTRLSLNYNLLSGTIPTEIGNLTELNNLQLGSNSLTGSIPTSLGNLTKLESLGLSHNSLTGTIPSSIGNLSLLQSLYLYQNNLSGSIPVEIGNLYNLSNLYLSENNLSGNIPDELENLTSLKNLYLDNNQLTGEIPSIPYLTEIQRINLEFNQFTGQLPECFQNFTNLKYLFLTNNQLTGLPDLSGLSITYFWAQNNNLTFGDIEANISVLDNYINQAKIGKEQYLYVPTGTNKTISIVTDGAHNTYQWFKGGVAISGATTFDYTITNFQSSDNGTYHCEVSNTVATWETLETHNIVLSSSATPVILSHPENSNTCCPDGTATFTVEAGYADTYQWQEKSPTGSWQNITDATIWTGYDTETLSSVASNIKLLDGYSYRCVVTNGNGSATSNPAVFNIESTNPVLFVQNYTLLLDATGNATLLPSDVVTGASDNCSMADTLLSQTSFDCSDVGTPISVDVTLTDISGNQVVETCAITIVDNLDPLLNVKSLTLELDATGNAILLAADVITNASDNCSLVDTVLSKSTFDCSDIGTAVNIDVTVSDASGNSVTKQVTVTVVDNIDPVLNIQEHTLVLDANGNATLSPDDVVTEAHDNCSVADTTMSQTDFSCLNTGSPVEVDVTLTDASGNSVTKSVYISVEDTISPVIISTHNNKTISDEGNCEATMPDYTNTVIATDNCGTSLTITQFPTAGTTISGQIPVTLTVADESGNETSTSFNLYVDDITEPNLVVTDVTLKLNAEGEAFLQASDVVTRATDNCTIADTIVSKNNFDCSDIGTPVLIDVTLTDASGNKSVKQATITVEDNIQPILEVQDITIDINESGSVFISASDVVIGATDNCTLADTTLSQKEFTNADAGVKQINVTLTDISGNSVVEQLNVTINGYTSGIGSANSSGEIVIYPQPCSDYIKIDAEGITIEEVVITDNFGKTVKQLGKNEEHSQIDIRALKNGFYLVRLKTNSGYKTIKLIKK